MFGLYLRGAFALSALLLLPQLVNAYPIADHSFDNFEIGSYRVESDQYRIGARVIPSILSDRAVEIWAKAHYPLAEEGNHPIVVMLHGNHPTCGRDSNPRIDDNCEYTFHGTCPSGYEVVRNHEGYDYIAKNLASFGYIVISINANRGINCGPASAGDPALNEARAKLILYHLELLSKWKSGAAQPPHDLSPALYTQIDFTQIGLFGHSRGGEAVRAAHTFLNEKTSLWREHLEDAQIQAIFEIGGADGQSLRLFDSEGAAWNQLLPMCDGDLYQLPGVKPYDRMLRAYGESPRKQKSVLSVWGTNHNYYNTEWQTGDSGGCEGHDPLFQPTFTPPDIPPPGPTPTPPPPASGSEAQVYIGRASTVTFFRANLGPQARDELNSYFNPRHKMPRELAELTIFERAYIPSPELFTTPVVEDFSQATGVSLLGFPFDTRGISLLHTQVPRHDVTELAARIRWTQANRNTFLQINAIDRPVNISGLESLDLRLSREEHAYNILHPSTNFSVAAVHSDGSLGGGVELKHYMLLQGPVGNELMINPIMHSARIPLGDFPATDLTRVSGFRLTFDDTPTGSIFLGELRISAVDQLNDSAELRAGGTSGDAPSLKSQKLPYSQHRRATSKVVNAEVSSIERVEQSSHLNGQASYEITITSETPFRVGGALLTLTIGDRAFSVSRFPSNGRLDSVIFSVPEPAFNDLANGQNLEILQGKDGVIVQDAGILEKPSR